MERLRGLDALFMALETPESHLHMMAVLVLGPTIPVDGGESSPLKFADFSRIIQERIHVLPLFRKRVARVPFGLAHPVWVDDAEFDPAYHLRRARLPSPGGPTELTEMVADIAGRPLDLTRPLWEMYLVEGLEGDHCAVVSKVHHTAIDGVGGTEVLAALLDLSPEIRLVDPRSEPWAPAAPVAEAELIVDAVSSLVRQANHVFAMAGRSIGAWTRSIDRNRQMREEQEIEPAPGPFRAPRSSINGAITSHRRFAFGTVPLADVSDIRRVFGGTVNDVVLSAVGGAIRQLLSDRGDLPEDSLVAMIPMSTRAHRTSGPGQRLKPANVDVDDSPHSEVGSQLANRLSASLVSLGTEIEHPITRLRSIAAATAALKEHPPILTEELFEDWLGLATPAVSQRLIRAATNLKVFDRLGPMFNVVVSNLRGPSFGLWFGGGPVEAVIPVGPIVNGIGLNVTFMSYRDTVYLGVLGCRELVPEVQELSDQLVAEIGELVKATARVAAAGRSGSRGAKAR